MVYISNDLRRDERIDTSAATSTRGLCSYYRPIIGTYTTGYTLRGCR